MTQSGRFRTYFSIGIAFILLAGPISRVETQVEDPVLVELNRLDFLISTDPKSVLPKITTILRIARISKNYSHQTKALLSICNIHLQLEQSDLAIQYCSESYELAEKADDQVVMGESLLSQATAFSQKSQYDQALKIFNQSEKIAIDKNDLDLKSAVYIMRGRFYVARSLSEKALIDLFAAYEIYQKDPKTRRIRLILSEIAKVYDMLEEYDKSIEYALKAIELIDKEKELMSLSIAYYNIGKTYRNLIELASTESYMRKALSISRQLNDQIGIAYAQTHIAWVLKERNQLEDSEALYLSALAIFEKQKNNGMLLTLKIDLAELKNLAGQSIKAIKLLKDALPRVKTDNTNDGWYRYHKTLAQSYFQQKDIINFARHIQLQIDYKDKINKADKEIATKNIQARFEIKQAETDILLLKIQNELQLSQIKQSEKEQLALYYALGLVSLVVAIILYILFMQISAREKFKKLALRDELTGSPNRRAIIEFAQQHFNLSRKTNEDFTVAIVDLDHFKNINDQYGHDTGDEVLKVFSQSCQESIRDQDKYGRFGGEEWLLVFPSTNTSHIDDIFHRINTCLENKRIPGLPDDVKITFSLGAAQLVGKIKSLDALLKAADLHLYSAKEKGRNCYSF